MNPSYRMPYIPPPDPKLFYAETVCNRIEKLIAETAEKLTDEQSILAGVTVIAVDPRYTSQQCSECGHTEKANRVSQAEFVCKNCDLHILADYNASLNIRSRALSKYAQVSEHLKNSLLVITGTKLQTITASV